MREEEGQQQAKTANSQNVEGDGGSRSRRFSREQSNRQQSDNCNWRISILSCISACCAISFEYISDQSLADSVCLSVYLCASICDREGAREGERESGLERKLCNDSKVSKNRTKTASHSALALATLCGRR